MLKCYSFIFTEMKLLIALGFLVAVSASPLANVPSNNLPVAPVEDFSLSEQLPEQDERRKTSEIILEAIITSLDKIQGEIIEESNQKVSEGIRNILNTIQDILKTRGKEEVDKEFNEIGHAEDKIRADSVLDNPQQDKIDAKELELQQGSAPAQENRDDENTILNNENESDKVLDSEQNEEDHSKVKFIDMVPEKNESDEAQSSKVAENDEQIEDDSELLRAQILNDRFLREPQEIQYIPPWMIRKPVPY
ncbi:unnamed protein product, partial [Brenthis ino]